jgi:hypothetical protein
MDHIKEHTNIEQLPSMKLAELKTLARNIGISGISSYNKNELVEKITKYLIAWRDFKKEYEIREQERITRHEFQEKMHRDTRDVQLRVQKGVSDLIPCLEYPFEFIRNGEYDRVTQEIPGQTSEEIGMFPDNIAEYYWISDGENDEKPWMTLCKLTNGVYVFYKGECDYTGFDCQGHMKIYASKDHSVLTLYGMSGEEYDKYYKDTQ